MIGIAGTVIDNSGGSGSGAVSSVFTRTGAVVATSGDYAVGQVTGAAPLASPALTGTPTAPTPAINTDTTQIATTDFIHNTLFRRRVAHSADGASATFQSQGEAAPSVTASTNQAKSFASGNGPAVNATTNSGSVAQGYTSPAANYKTGKNLLMYMTGWINTSANQRTWFGFSDQTLATMMASDNPAGNYAMFRYSSIAGDSVWQCITKDGTTQTIVSSAVAPTIDVLQPFLIIFNDAAANIKFYIANSLVATISTHLPTTATAVSWIMGGFNTGSGSFQNGVAVGQVLIYCDVP